MSETSQGSELQSETTALESAAPPSLTEGDKLIRESTQRCVFVGMQAFSGSYVCCFAVRELSKSLFIIAGVIAARRLWHGVCMEVYEAHLKLHKKKRRDLKAWIASLLMAAYHRKMSQRLKIIDYYGHIAALKLLLQRQINDRSNTTITTHLTALSVFSVLVFRPVGPDFTSLAVFSPSSTLYSSRCSFHLFCGLLLLHSSTEHCRTCGWCIFEANRIRPEQSFSTAIIRFWPPAWNLVRVCSFPHVNLFHQLLVHCCQENEFICILWNLQDYNQQAAVIVYFK